VSDELDGFWCIKARVFIGKQLREVPLGVLVVPTFFICPPGCWDTTLLNFTEESLDVWDTITFFTKPDAIIR
jgi:hypothetical protein